VLISTGKLISTEPRACDQIHWNESVFRDDNDYNIRDGKEVAWHGGGCIWPENQTGIFIGTITEASAPRRDQSRIPVHLFVIQVTRHQNGKTTTKAGRQIQIDERVAGR